MKLNGNRPLSCALSLFLLASCGAESASRPPAEQAAPTQVAPVASPPAPPLAPPPGPTASAPAPEPTTPVAATEAPSEWKQLKGTSGSSDRWGSGWLDLEVVRDFAEGTQLRLQVGGSAKTIAIRLLGVDQSPDDKSGIIGQYDVPGDRLVTAKLSASYEKIKQISVHGKYAWNMYGGPKNGPATVLRIEVIEPAKKK